MRFLFISFASVIFLLKNGSSNSDELCWSKTRQLAWSDFQGKIPDSTVLSAGISVKLKLSYEINKKLISVKLICFVAKKESWYKDTSNYALNHEQTHFNIGELTARMMRKQMDSLSKAKARLSIKEIKIVFESYSNKLKEMQDLYDNETNHSLNFDAEIRWENMIVEKLDKFKEFQDLYKEFSFRKAKE
jgi:hypothetical protein